MTHRAGHNALGHAVDDQIKETERKMAEIKKMQDANLREINKRLKTL